MLEATGILNYALYWLLIILLFIFFTLQVIFRVIRHWYHFPIPALMTRIIDNPFRRRFIQNPEKIVDRVNLSPGKKVVEIGPGKGSYTLAFARRVAPDGIVYACDIQEYVIKKLSEKAKKENVANIIAKIEDAHSFSFKDNTMDRVVALSCLAEIPEPVEVLKECRRILKPGGYVCLCELLPDPDYPLRNTEKKWASEAGLQYLEEFGNFFVYQLHFKKID